MTKNKNIKKVIRNGKVAVLYSPEYGAGWFTWNKDYPQLLFEPEIVNILENNLENKYELIKEYVIKKYNGKIYLGGVNDLKIEWILAGTQFKIDEYDGFESIITKFDENTWFTA